MTRQFVLIAAALPLALAGCGDRAARGNQVDAAAANAAGANQVASADNRAAAQSEETVLRSETLTGTFTGWEMGDYLWARISVAGREPISAQPGPSPIDLFLDANRGGEVTVEIATVRADIPEAGGETEIARIVAARSGATTAEAWWQGLSAADRAAAQRRFEDGALSGR
jgi:hypothetical protein